MINYNVLVRLSSPGLGDFADPAGLLGKLLLEAPLVENPLALVVPLHPLNCVLDQVLRLLSPFGARLFVEYSAHIHRKQFDECAHFAVYRGEYAIDLHRAGSLNPQKRSQADQSALVVLVLES